MKCQYERSDPAHAYCNRRDELPHLYRLIIAEVGEDGLCALRLDFWRREDEGIVIESQISEMRKLTYFNW